MATTTRLFSNTQGASPYIDIWDGDAQQTLLAAPDVAFVAQDYPLAVSNDGRYLAISLGSATSPRIRLYDLSSGAPLKLRDIAGTGDIARGMCFSPDGKWLFVTSQASPFLYTINLATDAVVNVASGAPTGSENAACNREGTRLIVNNSSAGILKIYSINQTTGALTFVSNLATSIFNAYDLEFSLDGTALVTIDNSSAGGRVWSVSSSGTVFTAGISVPGSTAASRGIAINPAKTLVAIAYALTPFLKVFDYPSMTLRSAPAGGIPATTTLGVAFSKDGSELICSGSYTNLIVYNTTTWAKTTRGSRTQNGYQIRLVEVPLPAPKKVFFPQVNITQ